MSSSEEDDPMTMDCYTLMDRQLNRLQLQDKQIAQYEDLLRSYKSTRIPDFFLVYSYDKNLENVEIIAENFMEFTELAYDHHYVLVAKKELNRNVVIYLLPFNADCQKDSTLEAINLLIDRKRKQEKDESTLKYLEREIRIKNKGIIDEHKKKIKELEDQLKEYAKKIENCEEKIEEQTNKIEGYERHLKDMVGEIDVQIRAQTLLSITFSKLDIHCFLSEKKLEMTKSSGIVNAIADRLCKKVEGDHDSIEPPVRDIQFLKQRRKEVVDYIEFIRINWNNPFSGTSIQRKIHDWFHYNSGQFLYIPNEEEKENSRKLFSNKFELENTIGTVHFLPIEFVTGTWYISLAICNYRIVEWGWNSNQSFALSGLRIRTFDGRHSIENFKFATDLEVHKEISNSFIHTSNKDVFIEHEKVVTWIKNNFDLDQRKKQFNTGYFITPSLYNFFVNFYDTSSNCS